METPKIISMKQLLNPHFKSLAFCWIFEHLICILSLIHSYIPGYTATVACCFTFQGCFLCSRNVIRYGLEKARPVCRKMMLCVGLWKISISILVFAYKERWHKWKLVGKKKTHFSKSFLISILEYKGRFYSLKILSFIYKYRKFNIKGYIVLRLCGMSHAT